MQTQNIVLTVLLLPLLAALYGCQPEEPSHQPQATSPAAPTLQQSATDSGTAAAVSKDDAMKLAKDIGCFACHSIEKKLLGPAWKTVAQINRGIPDAEARLIHKITKGGGGVWGNIEMPAYPDLEEAKKKILVKFILSLE